MFRETRLRTWAQSLTWRIVGIIMALTISYVLSDDLEMSLYFTFWMNLTGFILYYFHARIWNKIKWGIKDD